MNTPPLPGARILVVEDELPIRRLLVTTLEAEGYSVFEAGDVPQAETMAGNRRIDLYLIDLGLPGEDGTRLIERLRAWTQRPILVLSARSEEAQKVRALDAGADDYVTKPFGVGELHARIRVALRHAARTTQEGSAQLRIGALLIDLATRQVLRDGEPVKLTATQWRLLEVLARHSGKLVPSHTLLREVWGPAFAEQSHYLRIYIHQLRQKIEANPAAPQHLITETGIGYRLIVDTPEGD